MIQPHNVPCDFKSWRCTKCECSGGEYVPLMASGAFIALTVMESHNLRVNGTAFPPNPPRCAPEFKDVELSESRITLDKLVVA